MIKIIVFDLDGTLYSLKDKEKNISFYSTKMFAEIKDRGKKLIARKLKVSENNAAEIWNKLFQKYDKNISIGLEKEYGISRQAYFNEAWNIDAAKYIKSNDALRPILSSINAQKVLLTKAPKIWANSVLKQLNIADLFSEIIGGEGDVRKPQPEAFLRIATLTASNTNEILIIGDDEDDDIRPAKKLGMKTILIGKRSTLADYSVNSINDLPKVLQMVMV